MKGRTLKMRRVRVLCRKRGAIGVFGWELGTFDTWTDDEAKEQAFNWFQAQGYEVNAVELIRA